MTSEDHLSLYLASFIERRMTLNSVANVSYQLVLWLPYTMCAVCLAMSSDRGVLHTYERTWDGPVFVLAASARVVRYRQRNGVRATVRRRRRNYILGQ